MSKEQVKDIEAEKAQLAWELHSKDGWDYGKVPNGKEFFFAGYMAAKDQEGENVKSS